MKRGVFVAILLLLAMLSPATAQMNHKMDHQPEGEIKIVDEIKGRLKVTPAMSMLDLHLTDAKTDEVITQANIKATIMMPDGKKVEKYLPGMKMMEVLL